MDFGFSQEQQEVRNLARKILGEQVTAEKLAAYDEYQAVRFDQTLWAQLHEAGLPAVALATEYGGMGLSFVELALFIEEVGRSIAPVPAISHCVSAALTIQAFASNPLKQDILPRAAAGELLLGAALDEPLNDDPVQPMTTVATVDGDDLLLTGHKIAVPFAAQCHYILLAAAAPEGVAVVLLDTASAGVSCLPMRATTFEPRYELLLDGVRVAAKNVLCRSEGRELMRWCGERTTTALCAHQLGATEHAMRLAASYTTGREQFGVPVATFQAVGHRMANCYIDVECLRLTTYQAMSCLAAGTDCTTQVQIAKIWAGDVGHRVSYATQHVHGGMGIDRDYPLWRYCLWLRHNEMSQGCSAGHVAALGARIAAGEGLFD